MKLEVYWVVHSLACHHIYLHLYYAARLHFKSLGKVAGKVQQASSHVASKTGGTPSVRQPLLLSLFMLLSLEMPVPSLGMQFEQLMKGTGAIMLSCGSHYLINKNSSLYMFVSQATPHTVATKTNASPLKPRSNAFQLRTSSVVQCTSCARRSSPSWAWVQSI